METDGDIPADDGGLEVLAEPEDVDILDMRGLHEEATGGQDGASGGARRKDSGAAAKPSKDEATIKNIEKKDGAAGGRDAKRAAKGAAKDEKKMK